MLLSHACTCTAHIPARCCCLRVPKARKLGIAASVLVLCSASARHSPMPPWCYHRSHRWGSRGRIQSNATPCLVSSGVSSELPTALLAAYTLRPLVPVHIVHHRLWNSPQRLQCEFPGQRPKIDAAEISLSRMGQENFRYGKDKVKMLTSIKDYRLFEFEIG